MASGAEHEDERRDERTAALARALRRPQAYATAPETVGFLQTHVSLLFFAGERVYKVKKPVDLGFLDFTTLERRRFFCDEEVRLNRRLAPRVYRGVVPVVRRAGGALAVGGEGEVVDWAVEMERLPEQRMLDRLLEHGAIDNALLEALTSLLVVFHARAATGAGVDEHGAPEAVGAAALDNFDALERLAGDGAWLSRAQLHFLRARAEAWLAAGRERLLARVRAGRIREGHGDLHAGNVCFADEGVVAYDCLEFRAAFRCCDVASDLAFLAMDLDARGFPAFAQLLARRYADEARDEELLALFPFYKGYRAMVRAKVAALTAGDAGLDARARAAERRRALRYLQLAAGYELAPRAVLLCGLPASGKSWLAAHLARPLRAALLHSDARRRAVAAPAQAAGDGYGEGLYAPEQKERTYRALLDGALEALGSGRSVLVDATFALRRHRALFAEALARSGFAWHLVELRASEALTLERLARRAAEGRSLSEADAEVYRRARESFEPPDEVPAGRRLVVEATADAADGGDPGPEAHVARLLDQAIALG